MKYKSDLLKVISNIATDIEKNVISANSKFLDASLQKDAIVSYCEELFKNEFSKMDEIKYIKSKQKEIILNSNGNLIITYIEIDNFDLIDTNLSLGTLFGVYQNSIDANNLISAMYIAYGPSLEIVYSDEEKVEYYKLLREKLTFEGELSLSQRGKINSTAGEKTFWTPKHSEFIENMFSEGYRLRFSNSIVMDTHQILFKKGGLYSNPATLKNKNGEISTLFEAFPIAFVITRANGFAIDLKENILEKDFLSNETTPFYFGSAYEIENLKQFFSN